MTRRFQHNDGVAVRRNGRKMPVRKASGRRAPLSRSSSPQPTPQVMWRVFFVFLGVVLVDAFVPPVALLICLALAAYALRGTRQTLEAFTVLTLLLLLGNSYISLGRWLVLFACFGRIAWDTIMEDAPFPPILVPVSLFSLTIFVFAFLVSYIPAVSVLKIVTFYMGLATIMTAFYRTPHLRNYWFSWFFTLAMFIILASVPLFGFPYGYRKTGTGFQGILSHPQTYGIVAAIITALFTGLILFNNKRSNLLVFAALLGWVGIFTSQARTSLLATVVGLLLSICIGSLLNDKWRSAVGNAFSGSKILVVVVTALSVAILMGPAIQDGVKKFLLKDDGDASVVASLQDSRGGLIELSMQNFYGQPITGIGFGVPSDPSRLHIKTGPFGLPTGASVEKGFMPSAVLEETGLAGAFLILYIIFSLFRPVLRHGGMTILWVMLVCLIVNGGEMVFFAIGGGTGAYLWLMLGFCHFFVDPSLVTPPEPRKPKRRSWSQPVKT